MVTPVQENHYGVDVWVSPEVEGVRKGACLCLCCRDLNVCTVAKTLYGVCVSENLALAVSRCPRWRLADHA
jgi:hypothetical protein